MRILIVGLVVLALSVAGISTYLIQNFSTPTAIQELEKKSQPKKHQVLVAARTMTPGDKIIADAILWRGWPEESLSEHYITIENEADKSKRTKEVIGSFVRNNFQAGEPIMASKVFKMDAPGFMAGMLDKGMRAMALPIDIKSGVAGFILPGNYVDIIIVHTKGGEVVKQQSKAAEKARGKRKGRANNKTEEKTPVTALSILAVASETIMYNIKVLAVNQTTGKSEGKSVPAKTLTLQLTPKQVEILTTGLAMGKISVSLRDVGSTTKAEIAKAVDTPGTYTTDVEISPFLQNLNAKLLNKKKTREQLLNEKLVKLRSQQKEMEQSAQKQLDTLSKEKELAILEGKLKLNARIKELEAQKKAAEIKASEKETAPKVEPVQTRIVIKQPMTAPAPVKTTSSVIEIYRGGASQTQEIKIK